MTMPFFTSRFLFLPYVYADTALARTSDASAIPTAVYGSIPRNVTRSGVITAAALIPAKPVPRPAPSPAKRHTRTVNTVSISITPFLLLLALYFFYVISHLHMKLFKFICFFFGKTVKYHF